MATPFTSQQLAAAGANPNMYKSPSELGIIKPPAPVYSIPGTNETTTNPQQLTENAKKGIPVGMVSVPGVGIVPQGTYGTAPQQVNTSQPSPFTANATPYTQGNIQQETNPPPPNPDKIEAPATTPQGAKYQAAFNQLQSSGGAAPTNPGEARVAVSKATAQNTPQQEYKPSPTFMQYGDPIMQQFIQSAIASQQEVTDKGYLVQNMKQVMSNQLSQIDQKAMNLKNIIEGTDDDIRKEIAKAGGFATESQVQALAASRNKDLIRQYNSLEIQRQGMQQQLSANVQLAELDRQYAKDKYDNSLQVFNMYKTIDSNAQQSLDKLVSNVGYTGLAAAYGGDPYSLSLAEQKLGLPQGSLSDPNKLKFLETYRQQSLSQSGQRLNITLDPTSDPDMVNGMVDYYRTTGNLPPFGMGNQAMRSAFWKAVGASGSNTVADAAANKAAIAAATSALRNQQTQNAATKTAIGTFDKQMQIVQEYSNKVDRGGSPIANKYLLWLKGQVQGDADTAAFQNAIKTASLEFAKIMSGAAASIAGTTVSSQADAEKLINSSQNPSQILEIMKVMKREADARLSSYQETVNQQIQDIKNLQSGNTPKSEMVTIGGNQYEVGTVLFNSKGQKGRVTNRKDENGNPIIEPVE